MTPRREENDLRDNAAPPHGLIRDGFGLWWRDLASAQRAFLGWLHQPLDRSRTTPSECIVTAEHVVPTEFCNRPAPVLGCPGVPARTVLGRDAVLRVVTPVGTTTGCAAIEATKEAAGRTAKMSSIGAREIGV